MKRIIFSFVVTLGTVFNIYGAHSKMLLPDSESLDDKDFFLGNFFKGDKFKISISGIELAYKISNNIVGSSPSLEQDINLHKLKLLNFYKNIYLQNPLDKNILPGFVIEFNKRVALVFSKSFKGRRFEHLGILDVPFGSKELADIIKNGPDAFMLQVPFDTEVPLSNKIDPKTNIEIVKTMSEADQFALQWVMSTKRERKQAAEPAVLPALVGAGGAEGGKKQLCVDETMLADLD